MKSKKEIELHQEAELVLDTGSVLEVGYIFRDQDEYYWEITEHIKENSYRAKLLGIGMFIKCIG